jgi:hypothetical protein
MSVLKLQEVLRALLSADANAAVLIHAIIRNMPSTLYRIAGLLVESAATSSEAWAEKIKTLLLRMCELTPSIAPTVRTLLVDEHHALPAVAMLITLKHTNDEVRTLYCIIMSCSICRAGGFCKLDPRSQLWLDERVCAQSR